MFGDSWNLKWPTILVLHWEKCISFTTSTWPGGSRCHLSALTCGFLRICAHHNLHRSKNWNLCYTIIPLLIPLLKPWVGGVFLILLFAVYYFIVLSRWQSRAMMPTFAWTSENPLTFSCQTCSFREVTWLFVPNTPSWGAVTLLTRLYHRVGKFFAFCFLSWCKISFCSPNFSPWCQNRHQISVFVQPVLMNRDFPQLIIWCVFDWVFFFFIISTLITHT